MTANSGYIAVDLDGTLAEHDSWQGPGHIGKPIAPMVERVKAWRAEGQAVRIFTARVAPHYVIASAERRDEADIARSAIEAWCQEHLGEILPVTAVKDYAMTALYDDRCVQVVANTGRLLTEDMLRALVARSAVELPPSSTEELPTCCMVTDGPDAFSCTNRATSLFCVRHDGDESISLFCASCAGFIRHAYHEKGVSYSEFRLAGQDA